MHANPPFVLTILSSSCDWSLTDNFMQEHSIPAAIMASSLGMPSLMLMVLAVLVPVSQCDSSCQPGAQMTFILQCAPAIPPQRLRLAGVLALFTAM